MRWRASAIDTPAAALEILHDDAGKLFQASITSELYEFLREPATEESAT